MTALSLALQVSGPASASRTRLSGPASGSIVPGRYLRERGHDLACLARQTLFLNSRGIKKLVRTMVYKGDSEVCNYFVTLTFCFCVHLQIRSLRTKQDVSRYASGFARVRYFDSTYEYS